MSDWWEAFFDADYVRLWGQGDVAGSTTAHVGSPEPFRMEGSDLGGRLGLLAERAT